MYELWNEVADSQNRTSYTLQGLLVLYCLHVVLYVVVIPGYNFIKFVSQLMYVTLISDGRPSIWMMVATLISVKCH